MFFSFSEVALFDAFASSGRSRYRLLSGGQRTSPLNRAYLRWLFRVALQSGKGSGDLAITTTLAVTIVYDGICLGEAGAIATRNCIANVMTVRVAIARLRPTLGDVVRDAGESAVEHADVVDLVVARLSLGNEGRGLGIHH
jgi:hypothetical protein